MRKLLIIPLIGLLAALCGAGWPGSAGAAGLPQPILDCDTYGRLTHDYSAAELRYSLEHMPADIAEYTNCPNVINQALLADLGPLRGGPSGGGGGSFLPSWVIAVLVVVVLAGAGAGAVALRNRRQGT